MNQKQRGFFGCLGVFVVLVYLAVGWTVFWSCLSAGGVHFFGGSMKRQLAWASLMGITWPVTIPLKLEMPYGPDSLKKPTSK